MGINVMLVDVINNNINMRSTTFRPKKLKAKKKHGFMERMSTNNGRKVIKRRKIKGRKKVVK